MSASNEHIKTAVLIVGAGPTGLTLANVLGQEGIDVIIIDRKPATVQEPRAVSIDDESLRTMQFIGLEQEVLKNVVAGYGVHYFARPAGRCFAKVEPTANDYGYPRRNAFRQAGADWETRYTFEAAAAACVKMQTGSSVTIRLLILILLNGLAISELRRMVCGLD